MKKTILFACIEKNIGDDLFVKVLCDRYKDVDFYITSNANYGSLAKIKNLKFSKMISYWILFSSIGEDSKIKSIIGAVMCRVLKLIMPKYENGIFIVGNAFKNTDYRSELQLRWIKERVNLVDNFYLLSTNFGPFNDDRWLKINKTIFANMKDVCFRDEYSYNLFKELKNVRLAPDAIITYKPKINELKMSEKIVLISVIDNTMKTRGKELNSIAHIYEDKIVDYINHLNVKNYNVVLVNSNTIQDYPASKRIYDKCKNKEKVRVYNYDGDIKHLNDLYNNSSFILATRLHTIILSWLFDKPVIPLIYDEKVRNMMIECGYEDSKVELYDIDKYTNDDFDKMIERYSFKLSDYTKIEAEKQFEKLDLVFKNEQ